MKVIIEAWGGEGGNSEGTPDNSMCVVQCRPNEHPLNLLELLSRQMKRDFDKRRRIRYASWSIYQ